MKRSSVAVFVLTFCAAILALGFWPPQEAKADGAVVCIVTVNNGAATTTTIGDGGTLCPWTFGSSVALQCVDSTVCYDPKASTGGAATVAGDLCANFAASYAQVDPILINLKSGEKVISLIQKGLAVDGGTSSICKFAETSKPTFKP